MNVVQLGSMHSESFSEDPKHLAFVLARYHFVARMLQGKKLVLEIGCGDGTGARIVRPAVGQLMGCDIQEYDRTWSPFAWTTTHDFVQAPLWPSADKLWDAIYLLDVLEHVEPGNETAFLANIADSLTEDGVCVIGSPSAESQEYASKKSKDFHVNCKTERQLRSTLSAHFGNVFLFGMNDTTLHTGFGPMCHYRLAVCTLGS